MDYFAGLDISMDETHVCVLDREGVVIHEGKSASTAAAIAGELAKAPDCRRIVFETGRMAPILFHGLSQMGLPVVCVESRQAYQALKSLATHKTDRNDARGLAHLARTGFFKPVHVKSLSAHAVRSLIIARKKLVGQRVTLENQIRGLAVVFGIRLPRALTDAFIDNALKASEGIAGLSAAMRGLSAARTAVMTAVAAIDADMRRMTRASAACRRLMTIPGVGQPTAPAFVAAIDDPSRIRFDPETHSALIWAWSSEAVSVWRGRLHRRHLEMRGPTGADPAVRSRQCHADPLQGPAQAEGLGLRNRQAINHAQGTGRSGASSRDYHARDAARRDRVRTGLSPQSTKQEADTSSQEERRPREGADDGADSVACGQPLADCDFNLAAPAPSLPHQAPNERGENTGIPTRRHPGRAPTLDPLENGIRRLRPVPVRKERSLRDDRGARLRSAPVGHSRGAEPRRPPGVIGRFPTIHSVPTRPAGVALRLDQP